MRWGAEVFEEGAEVLKEWVKIGQKWEGGAHFIGLPKITSKGGVQKNNMSFYPHFVDKRLYIIRQIYSITVCSLKYA